MESDLEEPRVPKSKGPYAGLLWTRVLTPRFDETESVDVYPIEDDIEGDEDLSGLVDLRQKKKWRLLFAPSQLEEALATMTIDGETLDYDAMAQYSQIASNVRKHQLALAHATSEAEPKQEPIDLARTDRLSLKLYRQGHWFQRLQSK